MARDQRAEAEVRRGAFWLVALIVACDREPRPAQPAPQPPVVAPSILDQAPKPLASAGSAQDPDDLFGPTCKRGKEEAPPTLPFPVGIPAGTYLASWCRDGDAFFYPRGTKAADGALVGGLPDGAWTYYRETGERLLSGRFIHGAAAGLWRAYDPSGQVTQLGCFRAGEKRWSVTGNTSTADC